MSKTIIKEPPHPELDKELAARETKVKGQYTKFRAWIEAQGWRFCLATERRFEPVPWPLVDQVARAMGIDGDAEITSHELGAFLEECDHSGLTLCLWRDSNKEELDLRHRREYEADEITRAQMRNLYNYPHEDPDYVQPGWYGFGGTINDRLAAFFGIDRRATDRERDALLDYVRKAQGLA